MMSPVPCALSTMMLWLLKLMKHTVIWSLLLYWRHSTSLGKLFLTRNCWSCFWKLLVNKSSMAMTGWRFWWFWYEISKLSETQSHMKTGVVLETLDLARWIIPLGNFWWECFCKLILPKTCMTLLQCQADDLFYKNRVIIRNASDYLHAKCYSKFTLEISIHS